MWLCKSVDVTSDSEIQHPSPPRRQVQGGVHLTETRSDGRGIDGTASAVVGISHPEARDWEDREPGGRRAAQTMGAEGGQ